MWRAALFPRRRRILSATCVGIVAAAVLGSGAGARSDVEQAPLPNELWGVLVTPRVAPTLNNVVGSGLREAGVNSLIVNRQVFRPASYSRVSAFAARWKLTVISPVRSVGACRPQTICAVSAGTSTRAIELASQQAVDVVVVGLSRPVEIDGLRRTPAGSRILAVAKLGLKPMFLSDWRSAIQTADRVAAADFAVTPKRGLTDPALISYLSLLSRADVGGQAASGGDGSSGQPAPAPDTSPTPEPTSPTPATTPSGSGAGSSRGEAVANLWMDTDGGTCSRFASPSKYVDTAACSTMNAAYLAASLGDNVLIKAGRYPFQTIDYSAVKSGPGRVAFRGTAGTTLAGVSLEGNHVTLNNMTLTAHWYVNPGVHNILVEDVKASHFYIRCGRDVTVKGGEYTGLLASGVPTISSGGGKRIPSTSAALCPNDAEPSRDILIEGTYFHEIFRPEGSSFHRECLHVMGVDGLTIRNSTFRDCLHFHISFKIHWGSVMRNVVVEDSWFDNVHANVVGGVGRGRNFGLNFANSGTCEILVQRSTFLRGTLKNDCAPGGAGIRIVGNRFDQAPTCTSRNQSTKYAWLNNTAKFGRWGAACNQGSSND